MGTNHPATSNRQISAKRSWAYGIAAILIVVLWTAAYSRHAGLGICDEPGHWGIIEHFREGRAGWPDTLPHPPGYHYAVLAFTAGHPSPNGARAVTAAFAVLAIAAFAGAWRIWRREPAGPVLLSLVLLPILQPFTGMIYTDVPALAFVLSAWWAQLGGRRWLAGACLAAACFVRQTSIIWGTCFIMLELLRDPRPAGARGPLLSWLVGSAFRRCPGLLLVHMAVLGVVLWAGRLTPGTQHGNALHPNLANLYFAGALLFVLTAPVWFIQAAALWRDRAAGPRAINAGRLIRVAAIAAAATALLASCYRNPHVWNQELWWPDTPFTLLRNWPLVAADRWPFVRWLLSALVVLAVLGARRLLRSQPYRRELTVVAVFSTVLLGTNGLVEPRYFITPAVLGLFFLEISPRSRLILTVWFGLVSASVAPLIVHNLALW